MPLPSRVLRTLRATRVGALVAVVALGSVVPSLLGRNEAQAKPQFNEEILKGVNELLMEDGESLECTNASTCFFCHTSGVPQTRMTLSQPFFGIISGNGYVYGDADTAVPALEKLREDATDFNEDGTTDWEHLVELSNPNQVVGAGGSSGSGTVATDKEFATCDNAKYGCGARIAPPTRTDGAPLWEIAALALGAVGFGARRRR